MSEFYVTIEGSKQGKLEGESQLDRKSDRLTGISFHYAVSSPRDVASGQATGRRQHQPIVFTKQWGAASPQLFQALVTNEVLKSVAFEFVEPGVEGEKPTTFQTITLANAQVTQIEQYINGEPEPPADPRALERISLSFQRIEITNVAGGTTAVDDLKGARA